MKSNLGGHQSGLTLLEVLIAVLVLAIGLLGIAGLQTSALTNNFVSYQYTQAAILAQSMLERMRANRNGVLGGYYSLTPGSVPAPTVNCSSGNCTAPNNQAQWDMAVWYAEVTGKQISQAPQLNPASAGSATSAIPNSAVSITCPAAVAAAPQLCTIAVYWDSNRTATASNYSCVPSDSTALRCFQLAFTP